MQVKELRLYQFKNYQEKEFFFDKHLVCITGKNGGGKTNLLDAIYFLCFTKSYFAGSDLFCVMNEKRGMRINALFESGNSCEVQCILRENGKKEFSADGVLYPLLSKHLGRFPAVFIAPDDTRLITEGSEERRKFVDIIISQIDENYLRNLTAYNKILQQRNAVLKQWHLQSEKDFALLETYDEKMIGYAETIYNSRKIYSELLLQKLDEIYHFLSENRESIGIDYQSQLHQQSLKTLLQANHQKDILSQRSNYGIHKDDFYFSMSGMPVKQTASQGQRKSFLFGLKLAQFEILKEKGGKVPLLLLDDIFEKLDRQRSERLIAYISVQQTQVFITDTHKERLEEALSDKIDQVNWISL